VSILASAMDKKYFGVSSKYFDGFKEIPSSAESLGGVARLFVPEAVILILSFVNGGEKIQFCRRAVIHEVTSN